MFGYITINKPEIKFREFDEYRSFYCGVCHSLKNRYGNISRLTLNYDMTFLGILLTSLYEPETGSRKVRCFLHPFAKETVLSNPYIDYAADMTILLSYFKLLDDIADEKKFTASLSLQFIKKQYERIKEKYPDKCRNISELVKRNTQLEKEGCNDIDRMSGISGDIISEIFHYRNDEWTRTLTQIGFFLGKFIYLMDAYDDVEEDIAKNRYNILKTDYNNDDFDEKITGILEMMAGECTAAFETLPLFDYREILRNILYSGIWCKAAEKRKRKEEEKNA